MFDDGFSVGDVKAYRKECYDRIKDAVAEAEGKLQPAKKKLCVLTSAASTSN